MPEPYLYEESVDLIMQRYHRAAAAARTAQAFARPVKRLVAELPDTFLQVLATVAGQEVRRRDTRARLGLPPDAPRAARQRKPKAKPKAGGKGADRG